MSHSKFRVAICGGGISGLCLAVLLSKFSDVEVQLYEAAAQFKEIGAGVMIWSRTWWILELMGLADEFASIAHAPPDSSIGIGFDYRRSDQPSEGFRFHIVEVPHGCIRFHRAEFLAVFVKHLPDGVAHFGKRLVAYEQEDNPHGAISLNFADGSTATCDVLIGCDGIKSTIRKQLFEALAEQGREEMLDFIDPFWSGTIAYRGLIPVDKLPRDADGKPHRSLDSPMMYCGLNKHVVSYGITRGSVINVVTFTSRPENEGTPYNGVWVTECSREELLHCYSGWEPEVETLLKLIEKPTKWALHQLKPLPLYVADKIGLVGDSAHAMMPHQGAGAGQAIEDAFVLGTILGHRLVTRENIGLALKAYEHVRLPRANHVLIESANSGRMYEFISAYGTDYRALGPAIQSQWDWVWATKPEEEAQRGIDWLRDQLLRKN